MDGDRLALAVMGETNVELRFSPDVPVTAADGVHRTARVCFFADDPRGAARLLVARGLSPEERTTPRP